MCCGRFIILVIFSLFSLFFSVRSEKGSVNVTKIYLVSSCHLDLGFADSLVNIVNEYFDKHFPNAINTANELKQSFRRERLVFTTHSYLIWLYLNCPVGSGLHCPTESAAKAFIQAIHNGDIVWHAFPFNAQPEVYDQLMAEFGFKFTADISKTLGDFIPNTMSQRDVPGLTRSMIPILNKHGIKAVTVGVNMASMPPSVPTAFKWVDKISNTHVLAMWHPHGYGGTHGIGKDDLVVVDGMSSALAFAIRGDNSGPPSAMEVIQNYLELNFLYPDAEIVASGYNDFVDELSANSDLLDEYTQEIGDTWIHGVASDPWKTTCYREILRIRSDCIMSGKCTLEDERFYNFSAFLLKYGEHTWGKDVKTFLKDFTHWDDASFHSLMYKNKNYIDIANSWIEQREWAINYALDALKDHPIKQDILKSINQLYYNGESPVDNEYQQTPCEDFTYGSITFEYNLFVMAIASLKDSRGDSTVDYGGDDSYHLGQLEYTIYNQENFHYFLDHYLYDAQPFALKDFGKPGLDVSVNFTTSPKASVYCWKKEDKEKEIGSFLMQGSFDYSTDYGTPAQVWLEISLPKVVSPDEAVPITMTVYLVNKTSTRIPESLSLHFNPNTTVIDPSTMVVSKLGRLVNVLDVINNGSKHVHSSDEGIQYGGDVPLTVQAWDTNVAIIGGTNIFPVPMEVPDVKNGFSFNIFNNIWGTNYIMWYPYLPEDQSSKYRFTITLPPKHTQ